MRPFAALVAAFLFTSPGAVAVVETGEGPHEPRWHFVGAGTEWYDHPVMCIGTCFAGAAPVELLYNETSIELSYGLPPRLQATFDRAEDCEWYRAVLFCSASSAWGFFDLTLRPRADGGLEVAIAWFDDAGDHAFEGLAYRVE